MVFVKQDIEKVDDIMTGVRRCVRCVIPENYPGIIFDTEGVCNFCRYYDTHWGSWVASAEKQTRSEAKLRRIFEAAKRKGKPYDALVGISGGKDSSYCLYLCREVYGLKVLTFSRDNGFISDEARARIEQLVKVFDVPFIEYQIPLALELASIFMRKTGNFCAPCELGTFNPAIEIARKHDIPLILLGSSSRTDGAPPKSLNNWDPWYFARVLKGEPCQKQALQSGIARNYLFREGLARVFGRRRILCLPDYIEWDEEKIAELFQQKYGIRFGEEHSDCIVDGVKEYLYRKKCGGSGPKVVKYSLLIRGGQMTREEALEQIRDDEKNPPIPGLDRFLELTGMTYEEFETASEKSPEPYLAGLPRLFNTVRRMIRHQAA